MIDLTNIILNWLHLIATVLWIGGIAFLLFVAIPKTKQLLGQEAGKLLGEFSKRFKTFADLCIVLLVVTGVGLSIINKPIYNGIGIWNNWILLLILKHIFVFLMIFIHLFRNLILAKKINKESSILKKSVLQKLSLNLVKLVFIFGLIVLLLSVIGSLSKPI